MVTHHEYVEVETSTFLSPSILDRTSLVGQAVRDAVRSVDKDVLIVGGEIGPHNGGSPPCDTSFLRWSVFGNSFWYADALASKALSGYALFCRQDYIGADYGLVDWYVLRSRNPLSLSLFFFTHTLTHLHSSTGTPLPDFYTALIYSHTMGDMVLEANVTTLNASAIRSYASCSLNHGLTVLLMNLADKNVSVKLSYDEDEDDDDDDVHRNRFNEERLDWVLTGNQDSDLSLNGLTGLKGTGIALNGKTITSSEDGTIPKLSGSKSSGWDLKLNGLSIGFYQFPGVRC